MSYKKLNLTKPVIILTYLYLCLPVLIFLIGWCKWYVALSGIIVIGFSFIQCIKTHFADKEGQNVKIALEKKDFFILAAALLIICCWAALSGVGQYVWQNDDHEYRNTIFEILVAHKWPVTGMYEHNGESIQTGMVYYLGFWLLPAIIGKRFGMNAGYAAQYIWAVIGIVIVYLLLCIWKKKIMLWPLILMIFFSGMDMVGTILFSQDSFTFLGTEHLERWIGSYQFSSMTTQLFWVFNQAIPAWVLCILIFTNEKPKNMIFLWSTIMLTSTFPFAGMLPYIFYYLIPQKSNIKSAEKHGYLAGFVSNLTSMQNLLGGGYIGIVSLIYLTGNISSQKGNLASFSSGKLIAAAIFVLILLLFSLFCLKLKAAHRKKFLYILAACVGIIFCFLAAKRLLLDNRSWNTDLYRLVRMLGFYFLEAGAMIICLEKFIPEKKLLTLTAVWLFLVPYIVVGSSIDFCMRASIPGLFLLMIWSIEVIDKYRKEVYARILIILLLIGSVTSFHEIKRTIINSSNYYTIQSVEESEIMTSDNFSGDTNGMFWKFLAK